MPKAHLLLLYQLIVEERKGVKSETEGVQKEATARSGA